MIEQATVRNRILARISPEDFALLAPKLYPLQCPRGMMIAAAGQELSYAYFFESGIASVVAFSPDKLKTEAGIIGREGIVHPAIVLGAKSIPNDIQIQLADDAFRLTADELMDAVGKSESLRLALTRFAQTYTVQITSTALSNAVHPIDERLARWLLMVHDRSDSDDLALTHEFMSLMLAVRRPSVTSALHVLEGNGFITNDRGFVMIRNRAALEEFAADAYGTPEAEYERLLGPL